MPKTLDLHCSVRNCHKAVSYMADHNEGVGSCVYHLKRMLDSVLEEVGSVSVYPRWIWIQEAQKEAKAKPRRMSP